MEQPAQVNQALRQFMESVAAGPQKST
jgi:hypothetical protein